MSSVKSVVRGLPRDCGEREREEWRGLAAEERNRGRPKDEDVAFGLRLKEILPCAH